MPAEEQVAVIYAGVRGFLDNLEVSEISSFEAKFLTFLKGKHPEILETIGREGELTDSSDAAMKKALETFLPTSGLKFKAQD
mmetsp:Transcript_29116/g.33288  ORF Transcript_29116/g.33288 Transcript_29116/m.33288 type:complete len:82 (-) Transcript_29116:436-681(-)